MTRSVARAGVVVLALTLGGCGGRSGSSSIVASGHVEATDVRISTKVAGRLERFAIEEGDAVKQGQELGAIDTTDLDLALRQAKADRRQAAAELDLRVAGPRKEDIAEARAQVRALESDLDGARRDLERMQGLLDRGAGTTKGRDDAQVRRDTTAERLEAARQALARLTAGSRPEEIEAARAKVAAADARIAQLEQPIEDATVASPVAGVVTEKIAERGELLQVGSGLCVVTDLADAWLTIYVAEPDLGRIRIGQDADVRTDGGESRRGKVTFIASQAEFTPKNVQTRDERVKLVYRVKVGLDNGDGLFKPGMPAEARLTPEAGR
jgi:HlyD family secretion protein